MFLVNEKPFVDTALAKHLANCGGMTAFDNGHSVVAADSSRIFLLVNTRHPRSLDQEIVEYDRQTGEFLSRFYIDGCLSPYMNKPAALLSDGSLILIQTLRANYHLDVKSQSPRLEDAVVITQYLCGKDLQRQRVGYCKVTGCELAGYDDMSVDSEALLLTLLRHSQGRTEILTLSLY